MPFDFLTLFIALSLFFTVFTFTVKAEYAKSFSIVSAFTWWITALMPFQIEYFTTFFNTTSGQIVEHTMVYSQAWVLCLMFVLYGFIPFLYFISLVWR